MGGYLMEQGKLMVLMQAGGAGHHWRRCHRYLADCQSDLNGHEDRQGSDGNLEGRQTTLSRSIWKRLGC